MFLVLFESILKGDVLYIHVIMQDLDLPNSKYWIWSVFWLLKFIENRKNTKIWDWIRVDNNIGYNRLLVGVKVCFVHSYAINLWNFKVESDNKIYEITFIETHKKLEINPKKKEISTQVGSSL